MYNNNNRVLSNKIHKLRTSETTQHNHINEVFGVHVPKTERSM